MSADEGFRARIEALAEPQWRSVNPGLEDFDGTLTAWVAGRNWMIDQLRAALADDQHPEAT